MPLSSLSKVLEPIERFDVRAAQLKSSGLPYKSFEYYRKLSEIGRQARLVNLKRKRLRGVGLNPDLFERPTTE